VNSQVVFLALAAACFAGAGKSAEFRVQSTAPGGEITWSGAYTAGVCTVEIAGLPAGPWTPYRSFFTTNDGGRAVLPLTNSPTFCRLLAVDISTNSSLHFTNLLQSYGILETVAGRGQFSGDHVGYWQATNENGFATNANLSRPHISFGDAQGNVYIVDQGSSAVEKVTPDGRIHTYAGTHVAGFNGDGPAPATNLQLRFPNGGWLRSDGVFYVLDTENGKVRRIDTNGIMTTLVTTDPLGDGRALWVKSDESVIYFGSGPGVDLNATTLNRWTPQGGISVVSADFLDIGNILGDERTGVLYICDRGANRVYRMETNGTLVTIAGNGTTTGGGEGFPALQTGLIQPRSIWFLPNGGFFITEHDPGNRVWYVDPAGIIHRWLNGSSANNFRVGDGAWFYENPATPKVSRVRSINADPNGNLIITESNFGYVRRIRFGRLRP
jgi:hypothetical protein